MYMAMLEHTRKPAQKPAKTLHTVYDNGDSVNARGIGTEKSSNLTGARKEVGHILSCRGAKISTSKAARTT
jgi:hypothetical protein